jgi:hypothetical protein
MRFQLDLLSPVHRPQRGHAGRDGLIAVAMLFGFFFCQGFHDLAMGVLGAHYRRQFGVALSLGSGSFPLAQGA